MVMSATFFRNWFCTCTHVATFLSLSRESLCLLLLLPQRQTSTSCHRSWTPSELPCRHVFINACDMSVQYLSSTVTAPLNGWTLTFMTDTLGPQRRNPDDVCDPVSFHSAPPAGHSIHFRDLPDNRLLSEYRFSLNLLVDLV